MLLPPGSSLNQQHEAERQDHHGQGDVQLDPHAQVAAVQVGYGETQGLEHPQVGESRLLLVPEHAADESWTQTKDYFVISSEKLTEQRTFKCRLDATFSYHMPLSHISHGGLKPQALVYYILPPVTVITDYAIGLEKLSANGQFFVGVQTAVSL